MGCQFDLGIECLQQKEPESHRMVFYGSWVNGQVGVKKVRCPASFREFMPSDSQLP
jgi:hypothetical protein